jgi:hypothetical protein
MYVGSLHYIAGMVAYSSICDAEEREEHVIIALGHELAYHCLRVLHVRLPSGTELASF